MRWPNPIDLFGRRWRGRMTNNTKVLDNRKLMNRREHVTFGVRSSLMYEALQINKIPRKIRLNIIKSNIVPALPDQPQNINNNCNNKITHLRAPSSTTQAEKGTKALFVTTYDLFFFKPLGFFFIFF
jgi:hypothetical protein